MKIIGETDCPHCKKSHETEFDIDNLEPVTKENPKGRVKEIISDKQTTIQTEKPMPEIKIKEVLPSNIPAFKCRDGNCGRIHKNPNYKRAPKAKCTNCGQFTADPNDDCPWCNGKEFDEISDEDLENMNIPLPEHNHDHEE